MKLLGERHATLAVFPMSRHRVARPLRRLVESRGAVAVRGAGRNERRAQETFEVHT